MSQKVSAETEMPFLDHLEELRHRLFWIAGSVLVCIVASYVVLSQKRVDLIGFLAEPIKPYLRNGSLVYTHPGTSFKIILNASMASGLLLATPVIGYQLWGFFSPALHKHEKRVIVPTLFGMMFLFLCGVALCYFFVMPFTLKFFDSFESASLRPMIEATEYFDFALSMMLAFGLAFELPIAILLLSALGIVKPEFLSKYRRHAIVLTVIAAAFITPDASPTTLFALAFPLYMLYELGVALSFFVTRKRRKREREEALAEERARREALERRRAESVPREPRRLGVEA
ncbi:MAG TPA: twin-arginine translocase subunit TatC [Gemmatimonadaceae bacterium]|nr:twin-arginine translocase subunit TatC [Gemmatimonadaceae bacterium]